MKDEQQRSDAPDDQGTSENLDSNEKADDQVEILQPDGTPAPRAS